MCLKEIENIITEWEDKKSDIERADYILDLCDKDFKDAAMISDVNDKKKKEKLLEKAGVCGDQDAPKILHHIWAGDDGKNVTKVIEKIITVPDDVLRVLWMSDPSILKEKKGYETENLIIMPIAMPLMLLEDKKEKLGSVIRKIVVLELLKRNYVNASDILRLVVLWAYGGAYSDIADGGFEEHLEKAKETVWKFEQDIEHKLKIHIDRAITEEKVRFANDVFVCGKEEVLLTELLKKIADSYRSCYAPKLLLESKDPNILIHYFNYTVNTTGPILMDIWLKELAKKQKVGALVYKITTGSNWARRKTKLDPVLSTRLVGNIEFTDKLLLRGLLYVILDWTRIYTGLEKYERQQKELPDADFVCTSDNDHIFSFALNYNPLGPTLLKCVTDKISDKDILGEFWELVVSHLTAKDWIDFWNVKGKLPSVFLPKGLLGYLWAYRHRVSSPLSTRLDLYALRENLNSGVKMELRKILKEEELRGLFKYCLKEQVIGVQGIEDLEKRKHCTDALDYLYSSGELSNLKLKQVASEYMIIERGKRVSADKKKCIKWLKKETKKYKKGRVEARNIYDEQLKSLRKKFIRNKVQEDFYSSLKQSTTKMIEDTEIMLLHLKEVEKHETINL